MQVLDVIMEFSFDTPWMRVRGGLDMPHGSLGSDVQVDPPQYVTSRSMLRRRSQKGKTDKGSHSEFGNRQTLHFFIMHRDPGIHANFRAHYIPHDDDAVGR